MTKEEILQQIKEQQKEYFKSSVKINSVKDDDFMVTKEDLMWLFDTFSRSLTVIKVAIKKNLVDKPKIIKP